MSALTLPRGLNALGSFTFDLEGGVISFIPSGVTPISYQMSTRNELFDANKRTGQYGNGTKCDDATATCSLDMRSGRVLSKTEPSSLSSPYSHEYAYDASGRETVDTSYTCAAAGFTASPTSHRSYDADNHVIQQTFDGGYDGGFPTCPSDYVPMSAQTRGYAWSGSGHLATISTLASGNTIPDVSSVHWDGDDVLYVAGYNSLAIYTEKLGVSISSGVSSSPWAIQVYDRDWSGTTINHHGAAWFDALNFSTVKPFHNVCTTGGSCSTSVSTLPSRGGASDSSVGPARLMLDPTRADGYYDGYNVFQGVRAYDPNMGQWTTPDAYSGDVDDPMSQHPYMWNDNNPVAYSDPSGYTACASALSCAGSLGLDALKAAVKSVATKGATLAIGVVSKLDPAVTAVVIVLTPVPLADDTESGYNRDHPAYAAKEKAEKSDDNPLPGEAEHTNNARPSTEEKHQKGKARRKRDKKGGEKGDARRPW